MSVSGLLDVLNDLLPYQKLTAALEAKQTLPALELPTSARTAVLTHLYLRQNKPIVLLSGRIDTITGWQQALEMWLPEGRPALRFPEPTPLPFERGPWSERTIQGRLNVLSTLMAGQHPMLPKIEHPPFIITSARAFLQKTLPKRRFVAATRALRVGQIIDVEKLLTTWRDIGFAQNSVVNNPGEFSQRGGIIDIYPLAAPFPIRIELFGDEIDTMRYFDPATQRSTEVNGSSNAERIIITPAREAQPQVMREFAEAWPDEHLPEADSLPSWRDDIEKLRNAESFENLEYYLPVMYPRAASLLDYLPKDSLLVVDDWQELETAVSELLHHADQIGNEQPSLPPNYDSPLFEWRAMADELRWWQPLILGSGEQDEVERHPLHELSESFGPGPRYGGQIRPLMTQLRSAQREGERVVVVTRQAARLTDMWQEESRNVVDAGIQRAETDSPLLLSTPTATPVSETLPELPAPGSLTFVQGSLPEGFTLIQRHTNDILLDLLTDAEVFGWSRPAPRRVRPRRPTAPETFFADIQAGDYVVHLDHGVGLFQGLVVRNLGGMEREYLLVEYENGDMLYVPVHQADRLTKWIGSSEQDPKIHRLGGKTWTAAKKKARQAADELAGELIELYAARETISGHAFSPDDDWQAELEASFPHRETEDQLRVIAEVKEDMEKPRPMDRLICGDVGYGKTEVALRAAFKAVVDGKQVAILVPTTILAQQHYNTFRERLAAFPVTIGMLSRFRTQSQQKQLVKSLREGNVDIVIGTHRMLSDDVSFKDLGLVIIDEEQRFGVAHKEKLKQWRTEVDVLTMTATPIPRTLHMGLTGVRDISIIDTAPAERLPVQTYVGQADDTRLKRAILRELDRGGQVFMVHNRVMSIDIVRKQIERLVPQANVVVGHGQMSERKLEKIMQDFAEREIDILLATTIIESGLDFPNANTLIVDRADMFGLAQLYQLRGRVGRGTRRAYAYFFHRPWRTLTTDAKARLETIAEQTQLGAGYQIALRDLEIRGAGDILGGQQSGHISAVGFDLYTRLLTTAVKRRKAEILGEEMPPDLPEAPTIDLPLATYIPPDYVPDAGLRLRLYRRMALLDSLHEIDEMAEELADRFGPIPDPVHNLLYQLRVKALTVKANVSAVITEAGQIKIRVPDLEGLDRYHLQRFLGESVRVSKTAVWMKRDLSTHEWQIALVQVLERLQGFERQGNQPTN